MSSLPLLLRRGGTDVWCWPEAREAMASGAARGGGATMRALSNGGVDEVAQQRSRGGRRGPGATEERRNRGAAEERRRAARQWRA
jgi:hypothetical protein